MDLTIGTIVHFIDDTGAEWPAMILAVEDETEGRVKLEIFGQVYHRFVVTKHGSERGMWHSAKKG